MALQISDYLVTDDLTILLGLIAAAVFLLQSFYRPQPLVHPILLGRQSDVARVRNPGESAVYRNYGTGMMGRFPLRPHKDVHILSDFVRSESDAPRTFWNTRITNPGLQDRVAAFGTGLLRVAGVRAHESNVLLLLNDSIEFIISDLALAAHSIPSFTLTSADLLSPVLDTHPPSAIITQAELLPQLLELLYESGESGRDHIIVVVGEPSSQAMATVSSKIKVLKFPDVEREGMKVEKILSPAPIPSDIFTVSFYKNDSGHLQGVQFTHENITAGVAATKALVPIAQAMSQLDTLVSAYSLSTGFGRVIAYAAVFDGASFATLDSAKIYHFDEESYASKDAHTTADVMSSKKYRIPPPTIFFLKPGHLRSIVEGILTVAKRNLLFRIAWRHKLAGITEGFMTKDSLWDRLVFDGARGKVVGDAAGTLRNVVVSGGELTASILTPARVALSTPFVNAFTHPAVAGPILASHPLDLQDFSTPETAESTTVPVGPPSVNIEAKLVGVQDDLIENGGNPQGVLLVRGPPVGKLLGGPEDYVNIPSPTHDEDGWVGTGATAAVQTNGAFRLSQTH